MSFCSRCGTQAPDNAQYCSKCGNIIVTSNTDQPSNIPIPPTPIPSNPLPLPNHSSEQVVIRNTSPKSGLGNPGNEPFFHVIKLLPVPLRYITYYGLFIIGVYSNPDKAALVYLLFLVLALFKPNVWLNIFDKNPVNRKSVLLVFGTPVIVGLVISMIFGAALAHLENQSNSNKPTSQLKEETSSQHVKSVSIPQSDNDGKNVLMPSKNNSAFTGKIISKGRVANLYSSPDPNAEIVGSVNAGSTFPCYATQNGFFFFNHSGTKGWLRPINVEPIRAD